MQEFLASIPQVVNIVHARTRQRNRGRRQGLLQNEEAVNDCHAKKRKVSKWNWDQARQKVYHDYLSPMPFFKDRQFEHIF